MIAVVVPTIREASYKRFLEAWDELFRKHKVDLVTVWDGNEQRLEHHSYSSCGKAQDGYAMTVEHIMGDASDLIPKYTAACRNLGFAYLASRRQHIKYIITLDDDVEPIGDPIQDHVDILRKRVSSSWLRTAWLPEHPNIEMRGYPYNAREEREVWVSHGVWKGVPDLDAPTQLLIGSHHEAQYYRGAVPKGVYIPFCGMNVGFRREALPYMYYAPVHLMSGAERFDDIWLGVNLTRSLDPLDKAIVTGYSLVRHERASNVYANLAREYLGIKYHETYWREVPDHEFFPKYDDMRQRWMNFIGNP